MDDFRIYNRKLSDGEIMSLYLFQPLPLLAAASPEFLCANNPANITLTNIQAGMNYQLRNLNTNSNVGSPQSGQGQSLTFSTGTINETTQFTFLVTTAGSNCSSTLNPPLTIQFGPAAQPSIQAGGPTSFCTGQSVELSISATPGATYQWKRNGNNTGSSAPIFSATEAGTYTVDVINPCGTVSSVNSIVVNIIGTAPTPPTISAAGPVAVCQGQTVNLSIPSQSGVSYQWKRDGLNVGNNSNTFSATQSGLYTVELISACGNVNAVNSITVSVTTPPSAPSFSGPAPQICSGNSVNLQVSSTANVSWFSNPTGGMPIATGNSFNTGVLNSTTTFYAEAAQGACVSATRTAITVTVNPSPGAAIQSISHVSCHGAADGSIITNITGASSFSWNNGANSPNLSGLSGGSYTLTALAANGCSTTVTATVNEPAPIVINANVVQISCDNPGRITLTASGGTGTLSFSWAHGPVSSSLNNLPEGTYSVNITDANGCSRMESYVINPYTELQATANVTPHTGITPNGAISLNVTGGNPPYVFDWLGGENSANISGLIAGLYFVTITDSEGCEIDLQIEVPFSVNIYQLEKPQVNIYPNPAKDMLFLDLKGMEGNVQYEIFDIAGRLMLKNVSLARELLSVELINFNNGIYFIRLISSGNIHTSKFEVIRR
jgi:hypothetical protein